jgi:Tfp pilus assembly protein PilP
MMTTSGLRRSRLLLALAGTLLLGAGLAGAQTPDPAATPAPSPTPDTVKSIIDQELQPDPTGYAYNPQGRRDPFVSLLKPVSADQGAKTRRPGLEGLLIQEVALKGIVKDQKGYIAMLLGTDGKSYFVRNGQRLFDGVITAINAATVTFRQEVTDPLSTVKSRDVTKSLYPSSEEARQ